MRPGTGLRACCCTPSTVRGLSQVPYKYTGMCVPMYFSVPQCTFISVYFKVSSGVASA